MNQRMIVWVIGIVVVVGFLLWLLTRSFEPTVPVTPTPTSTNGGTFPTSTNGGTVPTSTNGGTSPTSTQGGVSRIEIAVLRNLQDGSTGTRRGCDEVVMLTRSVATTTAPLAAAMRELFAYQNTSGVATGTFSYIDKSNDSRTGSQRPLQFDRAEVVDGTAKVYVTGDPVYAGVCDDPRLTIQIEETAKQFPTVNAVEIYLNGQRYTQPSGRG
jgi:hypothetical protein